jgi:hypothetical protein
VGVLAYRAKDALVLVGSFPDGVAKIVTLDNVIQAEANGADAAWMAGSPPEQGRPAPVGGTGKEKAFETFHIQPEIEQDFFIWIRCNPLKSPESDE